MKKIYSFFAAFCLFGAVFAAPKGILRVEDSAVFKVGVVDHSTVLADEDATVFVEFPRTILATEKLSRAKFEGEILPPKLIEKPADNPKTRMQPHVSFEIVAAEGETLIFTDRIIGSRTISKTEIDKNPDEYVAGALPTLVFVTSDETVRRLKLWKFISEKEGWRRAGGVQEENENGQKIFTAKLSETGKYTIFDEWPKPKGIVFDPNTEYEQTLEYLEKKQAEIAAQIATLKAAGVQSKTELQALQAESNAQNQVVNESNLFEQNPANGFKLDPNLFANTNTVNTGASNSQLSNTPVNPSKGTVGPYKENFGLTLTPELSELSLASLTPSSPLVKAGQAKTLNTPTGQTINQPIGATLPEAGTATKTNWWSWNLFWLLSLFLAVIGGSWWVIKENS